MNRRAGGHARFLLLSALSFVAFWQPLRAVFFISLQRESHTHILVIAPLCLVLILADRRQIFARAHPATPWMVITALSIMGQLLVRRYETSAFDVYESASVLMFVVALVAAFLAAYGPNSAARASFPLGMLVLLVPIPVAVLDRVIWLLQAGSAEMTYLLLKLSGVPVIREGFFFRLPRLSIQVAEQCSGIRSSIALALTMLFIGQFTLRSFRRKALLVLLVVPVVILKNAIRITTLSLLAIYVDPGYMFGSLHHEGGVVFYLLGLAIMAPICWYLRKSEHQGTSRQCAPPRVGKISQLQ